jgi:hypothetical protein
MDDFDRQNIARKVCKGCIHFSKMMQYPWINCAQGVKFSDLMQGKKQVIKPCSKHEVVETEKPVVKSKEKTGSILDLF